jgi:hypothetical protein
VIECDGRTQMTTIKNSSKGEMKMRGGDVKM